MSSFEEDLATAQEETEKRATPWVPWKRWEYGQQKIEAKIIDLFRMADEGERTRTIPTKIRYLQNSWADLAHKIREAGGDCDDEVDLHRLLRRARGLE